MSGQRKIQLGPDNNPGNARWCEQHGKMECTKRRKNREQCHGPAVRGMDCCPIHGGHRRDVLKAKGEARITAWSAVGEAANRIDSGMAVLGMLQQSWLRAHAYGELLRQQVVKDGLISKPEQHDPENIVNSDGLIGYRYGAAGKDGNIYAVSEETRGLVILEAQERDRVVKFAKVAHDMGISERLTNLAEKWGDLVVGRIMLVLEALSLTPDQEAKVPALIQAHLGQIEITSGGIVDGEKKS